MIVLLNSFHEWSTNLKLTTTSIKSLITIVTQNDKLSISFHTYLSSSWRKNQTGPRSHLFNHNNASYINYKDTVIDNMISKPSFKKKNSIKSLCSITVGNSLLVARCCGNLYFAFFHWNIYIDNHIISHKAGDPASSNELLRRSSQYYNTIY